MKDSLCDSEQNDTIGELPGLDIQQDNRNMYIPNARTYNQLQSSGTYRRQSYSPSSKRRLYAQVRGEHRQTMQNFSPSYTKPSSLKANVPNIIGNKPVGMAMESPKVNGFYRRQIRSGAFQRISTGKTE